MAVVNTKVLRDELGNILLRDAASRGDHEGYIKEADALDVVRIMAFFDEAVANVEAGSN